MGGSAKLDQLAGVGTVLAGKYRIERVVGAGGMGAVAAALHLRLGARVAVKLMLPRPDHSERSVARFLREAKTASRITSPHVARVFDVDLREDGVPYIVMEYLEGETLATAIRRGPRLDVPTVVDDLLAASEALAEAHALGIVHRDLKPGNLFRARLAGRTGHVLKVLDFGISKTFDSEPDDVASVTTGKGFVGSPPYMSPEQITLPGSVDLRTDLWSLGVVLYECLTGISPFSAATVGATCARILHEEPPPPSNHRPELPPELDQVALRCLAKEPRLRYQSIVELGRELAPFGGEASARYLSSLESHWANAAPISSADAVIDSERGDFSTETALESVPSLAGLMQSTFRRLPRRLGASGVTVLVFAGAAALAALGTRGSGSEPRRTHAAASPVATAASLAPPVPSSVSSPAPAPGVKEPAARASAEPVGAERSVRAKPARRSLADVRPASPSALPPAAPPPIAPTAPRDPEAIYTDRK